MSFGIVKDIFNCPKIQLEFEGTTAGELRERLENKYPKLRQLASYMISVNNEYATDDTIIKQEDEIAIIPPVSGG